MSIIARLVAVALVAAAASLAVPSPAAYAAPCTGDSGVSVVVDFNGLGGGVQQVCVSGGGGDTASSLFPAAGFPLSYASRQPGFVCRVKGVPTSDPCVNTAPADAFWGLWWSDGDASSWTFSSLGRSVAEHPGRRHGGVLVGRRVRHGAAEREPQPPRPRADARAQPSRRRTTVAAVTGPTSRPRPTARPRPGPAARRHPRAARRRPRARRTARRARGTTATRGSRATSASRRSPRQLPVRHRRPRRPPTPRSDPARTPGWPSRRRTPTACPAGWRRR